MPTIAPNDRLESVLGDFSETPTILRAITVIDKSKEKKLSGCRHDEPSCSCDIQCRCDNKCNHCFCYHHCSCERDCSCDCGCDDHCPDTCKYDYNP